MAQKWQSPILRKKSRFGKNRENVVKMTVFWLFLKNGSNDFSQNAPECRTNRYWTARENRMSKFGSVLEIFIHKVSILAKNGESGVQRSLYISRTVNGMKNLIRYSESTENFLSDYCRPFFHSSSSSGRKFGPKIGNFWPKKRAFLSSFRAFSSKLLEIYL